MKISSFILLIFVCSIGLAKASSTPLNDAARSADSKTVQLLISNGTDPNEINKHGSSALSGAAGNCSVESKKIIKLLFANGAKLNHQNPQGLTSIGNASASNCYQNVQTLLELGAAPDIPANNGWTPLIYAVSRENAKLVTLLVGSGASVTHKTNAGYDAISLAEKLKNSEIKKVLISSVSSDVNEKTLNLKSFDFCGLVGYDGLPIQKDGCPIDEVSSGPNKIFNYDFATILISFLITWTLILVPPLLFRFLARKPFTKLFSVIASTVLFCVNILLFTAMGSQNETHFATMIGAFLCYKILTLQFKKAVDLGLEAQPEIETIKVSKIRRPFSKNKKIWIVASIVWVFWVSFRTFDSFELIGFDLNQWDDEYFFLNLFIIPILMIVFSWCYTWISKSSDSP